MKKKFRIAVAGATTDGRNITPEWIEQMARTYDPKKYGARINLEHFRGVLPDGPFKAYGDVLALHAEEVEIDGTKRLALYAEIDPTPDLVELSKKRQKIYTSCEVNPDFAGSGQAYLVGLAVTDSPASLGTEMLKFAAGAAANPFAARKQSPQNLFSEAIELSLDFDDAPEERPGLLAKVRELLSRRAAGDTARQDDTHQAVTLLADNQRDLAGQVEALRADLQKATDDFAAFVSRMDQTPPQNYSQRPPATGGDAAGANMTDC